MARDERVLRQWRVWRLLAASPTPLSAEEVAGRLGPPWVSGRTVRRDLDVLRRVGALVADLREGRSRRYGVTDDGPGLRLDGHALLALHLAAGLLRPFEGTPVGDALDQVVRDLERRVPPALARHFRSLVDDLVVRPGPAPRYATAGPVLEALRSAMAAERAVVIDYAGLEGPRSSREVHPQAIVWAPRGLYVLALDPRRGAVRTFRLDRIAGARPSASSLRRVAGLDAEAYLAGSLGVFSPEHAPRRCVLRVFSRRAARLLQENPWHASQRVEPERGGTWRVELTLRSTRELLSRVLSLGPDAEVQRPAALRREVAALARRAAARYGAPRRAGHAGPPLSSVAGNVGRGRGRPRARQRAGER